MPEPGALVPLDTDVFRYQMSDSSVQFGVPTDNQRADEAQQSLIEIDVCSRPRGATVWQFNGYQMWLGVAQLIMIEEVPHAYEG